MIAGIEIARRNHEVQRRICRDGNRVSDVHAHHQTHRGLMVIQVRQIRPIGYQVSVRARAGPT